jgi:low temperature requirement protein LtrA
VTPRRSINSWMSLTTVLSGGIGGYDAAMAEPPEDLDDEEREQLDLVRPPEETNQEDNRTATRLELFFDLAFVLFVARCADLLGKDGSWTGAAVFAGLLTIGWWAWASTTLYANRFDTDDTVFRVLTLLGMGGVVAMAAAVDDLGGATGRWFAVGYVLVRVALIAGYVRAWVHVPDARPTARPYLYGHGVGALLWAVSIVVPPPVRYVLWGLGVLVDLIGPTVAARTREGVPLHVTHLPERFALFIILVLGESVHGVVTGLHDGHWSGGVVLTAVLAFVLAASLWWLYFDLVGGIAKRRLLMDDEGVTRQGVHDVYTYAHLPVAVSLAAVAVGLEHAVVHGGDVHLEGGARWVLALSVAGYLAATALVQAAMTRDLGPALRWPAGGIVPVVGVALLDPRPAVLVGSYIVVLLVGLAVGIVQHREGQVRTAKV